MKTLYTSPAITVEELTKVDVLCASTVTNNSETASTNTYDNVDQLYSTLGDFSRFM